MDEAWPAGLAAPDGGWDAVVVGAGPAGLAAATLLARHGASTLLLDEQPEPGGQIYRGVERASRRPEAGLLGKDYFHGVGLIRAFRESGAAYLPETGVWNITRDLRLHASRKGQSRELRARALVLAVGAIERPVPLPGWTLPGVMTAGAVQILLKSAMLRADVPLVIAGSGPLFYLLAMQCHLAGAPIAGLLDTSDRKNLWPALKHLPRALGGRGPSYLLKGLRLKVGLRRAGIPVFKGMRDIELHGRDKVEAVSFVARGARHRLPAGIVALHEGVIPHQNAARLLGCGQDWDPLQNAFRPATDKWGRTGDPAIFMAGDAAGIVGARGAEHQGRIAALGVLQDLGRLDGAQAAVLAETERRELRAHAAVRPFLDRLYPPSRQVLRPADAVVACRCEEVTAGAIRELAERGYGANQIKAELRCGMGPCQGRLCGPTVTAILSAARDTAPAAGDYYAIRPPLKPLSMSELASLPPGQG
jgi:NADPH-dependent 2,4-dienoyl-CoA reductase/sulfur reductase-like enzyme